MTSISDIYDMLDQVANAQGKNEKWDLIRRYRQNPELCSALDWIYESCYNPFKVYGIANITIAQFSTTSDTSHSFHYMDEFLQKLLNKSFNQPRVDAAKAYGLFGQKGQSLISRILKGDLRSGVSGSSYNKIVGHRVIPEFNIQKAECAGREPSAMLAGIEKRQLSLCGSVYVSPKLDGIRIFGLPDGRMLTSNGKPVDNYPHISMALRKIAADREMKKLEPIVLDGELYDGGASNSVMTQATRKKNVGDTSTTKIHTFDCLTVTEFETETCKRTMRERYQDLVSISRTYPDLFQSCFHLVLHTEVSTISEVERLFRQYLDERYEGVVTKIPNSRYAFDRTFDWMKVKQSETDDVKVVGFLPGEAGKKYEKTLGALLLENGCHVGYGLTDDMRDEIWSHQGEYLYKIVEVRYDTKLTKKDGSEGTYRFPRFIRWRTDK